METDDETRLERRAGLVSDEIDDLNKAMLCLEIATDPDEPPLTGREAAAIAGPLLRHAALSEFARLAFSFDDGDDLPMLWDGLVKSAETEEPEACEHFRQLAALGHTAERLAQR